MHSGKQPKIFNQNHRWTPEETITLLDDIILAMKTKGSKFERPTARIFYTEHCMHSTPYEVDWMSKKHKMRHLKSGYIKAKEWKETVASELFESDKKHISDRIKRICPHYNKLDEIFGPILNSDPIGPMVMDEDTTVDNSTKANTEDNFLEDDLNNLLVPKHEFSNTVVEPDETEAEISDMEFQESPKRDVPTLKKSNVYNDTRSQFPNKHQQEFNEQRKEPPDMEQMKFYFEKEKFELNIRLETRKLNLEKERLNFEKTKFFEMQKLEKEKLQLRKYELDKQFELKKLEIQKDERIQRLSFEERTFDNNEN